MIKKYDKAVKKPKGKRAQETQMLGGMPKSQEKSDNQDKVSMLQQSNEKEKEKRKKGQIKEERQKKI